MRLQLLGPLVVDDDGSSTEVRGTRQQALLSLLALHVGSVISTERIVDELWGVDAPANPTNAVQAIVSRLRKVVGTTAIVARGAGYALDVPADAVDAVRFERLVARAREATEAGDPAAASRMLRQGLDLWRGPAFEELGDLPFARSAASRLEELRGAAIDAWADAELSLGHHDALIADLRAAVDAAPLREGGWLRLMLALYRAGRQADALRAYQDARAVLGDELGIEPGPELRAMEGKILAQSPELARPEQVASAPPGAQSLPRELRRVRTSFVGRTDQLEQVEAALAVAPLVTLVGPGGVGKTRLACEVAARRAETDDRVVWVDLAPLVSDDDVAEAVAIALGGRDLAAFAGPPLDALERAAATVITGPVLAVVDNCEHVIEAAALAIEALIAASAGVRVLATSREGIGVPGEQLHPLPPLTAGDGTALFIERAAAVRPGFEPTADERDAIAEICERLDGLPLAIELAAARVRALPVPEIADRLDDRFRLLTGGARTAVPRQQTLRAVVEWSHELLRVEERHVLARLSAFVGGFTLDDAAEVVGGDKVDVDEVGDVVLRLVDKSLVTSAPDHPSGAARFGLLQTLWHYSREQLVASGDEGLVRERHARHFADLARQLDSHVRGPGQREALDRLELEHDNLRAALEWAVEARAADVAGDLVGSLGWFWYVRGYVGEGARWAATVVERAPGPDLAADVRVRRYAALLGLFAGRVDLPSIADTVALARRVGDVEELAETLVVAAALYPRIGDADSTAALLDEAADLASAAGNRWLQGTAALLRAGQLAGTSDVVEAHRLAGESIAHFRAHGDDWGLSMALMTRAMGLEAVGDYEAALADYTEAHDAAERLGSDELGQHFRIHRGNLLALAGDVQGARRNHEHAVAAARRIGSSSVLGMALNGLGLAARRTGDLDAAMAAHDEARALYLAGEWWAGASLALAGMGFAAEQSGDADAAWHHHLESLHLAEATNDERAIALACEGLAGAAALRGDHELAARLLGHADRRRVGMGAPLPTAERADVDRIEARVVDALGSDRYGDLAAAGASAELESVLPR